ncbi:MAG: hypothetical protein KDB69_10735, partial [Acidimicrobiia bacterium]|nr:hypothetical protein [Acidimicrobiia bacterium]
GIKPLAWLAHPKRIVFSSQYDAVIRHPWCERQRLRPDVTALFLRFGYVPSPYGIVEGTRQVPQGSIVRWSPNGPVRHTRYWAVPEASPPLLRGDEAQRQVLSAIRTAVDRQLVADVPVGTFLSGGIDSPLVTAVAHAGHSAPVPAFTIGTDDVDLDESGQAARYARQLQVAHQVETITETDALNLFDDVIDAYGEPFGDISAFPTMLVSRLARKHVTVALSGDGGDELFFGYPRMWNALRWRQTFHLPPLARRAVRKALHRWPSLQPNEGSTIGTIGDMVSLPHSEFGGRRLRSIAPGLGELPGDFDLYDLESVPKRAELAQWLRRNEMVGHLEKMLLKVDRASMHESLEVRVPLLDDEVVSAAIATDPEVCMDGGIGKLPLRQALADYVPESIITKPKKGFDPPLANWFRGALSDRLVERVVENPVVLADAFDRNEVRQLVDSHQMGQDNSRPLWHLLALQEWAERHLRPLPRS